MVWNLPSRETVNTTAQTGASGEDHRHHGERAIFRKPLKCHRREKPLPNQQLAEQLCIPQRCCSIWTSLQILPLLAFHRANSRARLHREAQSTPPHAISLANLPDPFFSAEY
jgi:hypothetical protein